MASDELIASGARDPGEGAQGVRPGCLAGFGALVLGALIVIAVVTLLMRRGDGAVDIGNVARYAPGTVTYRSTDGVLVVRQAEGGIVAFSDVDPHNPPGRSICRVTYRPDLPMGGGMGATGRFFDRCTGSTYDLEGHGESGDGRDLRTLRVEQTKDGHLKVWPAAK